MEYGVYTSKFMEIAQTKFWTLCLQCNADKTMLSAELYNGIDEDKTLAAIVKRNNEDNSTLYAYEVPSGEVLSNDMNGVRTWIGKKYNYNTVGMKQNDVIQISEPYEMPSVSEKGIESCLRQWRMGTFYNYWPNNGMMFRMVTNKVEYIFMIQDENCNIYCGASVNIPCEQGLYGSGQYFRMRNQGDNSQPFCRFECNLGNDITISKVPVFGCETGSCIQTEQGLYWPLKRFNDDEIVLNGCGDEEYIYTRNKEKSEYFYLEV